MDIIETQNPEAFEQYQVGQRFVLWLPKSHVKAILIRDLCGLLVSGAIQEHHLRTTSHCCTAQLAQGPPSKRWGWEG